MDENPTNGQVIGQIEANTNEGDLSFTLSQQQNPAGALAVNATSGELTVADETLFDFETNSIITAVVTVANGGIFQNIAVELNLQDVFEEKVYEGDVILNTQKEVDTFGANGYTRITGTLTLGLENSTNNIILLHPLLDLIKVDGSLLVQFNKILENMDGLSNLTFVGNDIEIYRNDNLKNIDALEGLTQINGRLILRDNNSLLNIEGFQNVTFIESHLFIEENNSLINLEGLNNITFLKILRFYGNSSLQNINALSNLKTLQSLSISNNPLLSNINGLEKITSSSIIRIANNDLLNNLEGLKNLQIISGDLIISQNDLLNDLEGLRSLQSIGGTLIISTNEVLTNLNGLSNLNTLGWELKVYFNDSLSNLCGLQKLLKEGKFQAGYYVYNNTYNPTEQDIIDGNCSL
tara:strand:- start:3213 stop:4436 length:1224 start_codon:yes stop_codon:yes gene_type:complete